MFSQILVRVALKCSFSIQQENKNKNKNFLHAILSMHLTDNHTFLPEMKVFTEKYFLETE